MSDQEIELKNPCDSCCDGIICSSGLDPDYLLCEKLNLYRSHLIPFNKLKAELEIITTKYNLSDSLKEKYFNDCVKYQAEITQLKATQCVGIENCNIVLSILKTIDSIKAGGS